MDMEPVHSIAYDVNSDSLTLEQVENTKDIHAFQWHIPLQFSVKTAKPAEGQYPTCQQRF